MRHTSASRTAVWLVTTAPWPNNQPLLPSGRWVVRDTQNCEWIGPAYSANLLARAYAALKEKLGKVAFTLGSGYIYTTG